MSTTKPDTETGWSKDVPTINGWYWLKDDKTGPVLTEALNGCFYVHNSRYMPEPNDEWLGPISPSDFEQLIRLREAAEAALIAVRCPTPHCNDAGMYPRQINDRGDAEPEQCEFCETNPHSWFKTKAALRNALNPPTLSVL